MARRLIAATLSLSLALTGVSAAPARAQSDENMGRLIGSLVAIGVIGAAAKKERDKEREKAAKEREKAAKKAAKEDRKAGKKAAKARNKAREEAREERHEAEEERREALEEAREERREALEEAAEAAREGGTDARTRAALGALSAIVAGQGAEAGVAALAREFGLDLGDPQAEARAQAEAQAQAEARAAAEKEARRAEIERQAEAARRAEIERAAAAQRQAAAQTAPRASTAEQLPPIPRSEVTPDLLRDWQPTASSAATPMPQTTTPVATGEIPFACLRRAQTGFEAASVVDGDCLDDYPVLARSLPLDCAVTGRDGERITSGYDTQCLRGRGYRVAVR